MRAKRALLVVPALCVAVVYSLPCSGLLERHDRGRWHSNRHSGLCTLASRRTEVSPGATVEQVLEFDDLAAPGSSAYRLRIEIIGADGRFHETRSEAFTPGA